MTKPFGELTKDFTAEDKVQVARMSAALKKHHDNNSPTLPDLDKLLAEEEARAQTVLPEK